MPTNPGKKNPEKLTLETAEKFISQLEVLSKEDGLIYLNLALKELGIKPRRWKNLKKKCAHLPDTRERIETLEERFKSKIITAGLLGTLHERIVHLQL